MISHFKKIRKGNTGKIGVWDIKKNTNTMFCLLDHGIHLCDGFFYFGTGPFSARLSLCSKKRRTIGNLAGHNYCPRRWWLWGAGHV